MKEYSETLKSIYAKAGVMVEKRDRRNAVARRITFSVSGMCAAFLIGISLRNNAVKNGMDDIGTSSPVIGETQPPTEPTSIPVTVTITTVSAATSTATSTTSQTQSITQNTTAKETSAAESSTITTTTRPLPHGEITTAVTTLTPPDIPLTGKYSSFEFAGGKYITMGESAVIATNDIAEKITENTFPDGQRAEIFRLKNYAADAALAVRFEGADELFFYVNCLYSPQSFGSWANDFCLDSSIFTGSGRVYRCSQKFEISDFTLCDPDALWEALMSLKNAENCEISDDDSDIYELYFAVNNSGLSGSIRIYSSGFVEITGSTGNGSFYAGEDITNCIIELI